jgi:hypothetical protein
MCELLLDLLLDVIEDAKSASMDLDPEFSLRPGIHGDIGVALPAERKRDPHHGQLCCAEQFKSSTEHVRGVRVAEPIADELAHPRWVRLPYDLH